MRKFAIQALAATVLIAAAASPASAGGWSGDDSSILRAHLAQGKTLSKIWALVNDR
jgi:hypothetical protein